MSPHHEMFWRGYLGVLFSVLLLAPSSVSAEVNLTRRDAIVQVVESSSPAVVNVNTETRVKENVGAPFGFQDPFFDQFFKDFFEMYSVPRERVYESLGSGAIIDESGIVLTNEHVIKMASKIKVSFVDGTEFLADVLGADPGTDIAVLQVKREGSRTLPALKLGRSDDLMIGETVVAIGNPFGLSHTVTSGVISALHRSVRTDGRVYQDFIQIDASINPGNSGGPLLNVLGEMIGVNTAIVAKAQGIGFAIPIDRARRIVSNLLSQGEVSVPWYGARVQALDEQLSAYFKVPRGVIVTQVEEGSPAERAGIRRKDVILSLEGTPIEYREDFYSLLRGYRNGDRVRTELLRDGEKVAVAVIVRPFPETKADELAYDWIGIGVAPGPGKWLAITKVRPNGPAFSSGLRPGDVLIRMDGRPVRSIDEFKRIVLNIRGQASILLEIQRGNYIYRVVIEI